MSTEEQLHKHGLKAVEANRVGWADDSRDHPRNWRVWTKCYTAVVVTWLEAYMTAISSAGVSDAWASRKKTDNFRRRRRKKPLKTMARHQR